MLNALCDGDDLYCDDNDDSDTESGDESGDDSARVTFEALHWLFEVQDNDVSTKVLGSSDVHLEYERMEVTAF